MKKLFATILAVSSLLCMMSCGHGPWHKNQPSKKEKKEINKALGYFSKLSIDSPYEVVFKQTNESSVRIVGNSDDVADIVARVEGTVLKIWSKRSIRGSFREIKSNDVKIYIASPDLTAVIMRGLGVFKVDGAIDTDTLDINLNGLGDMAFNDIVCDNISVMLRGGGNIEVDSVKSVSSSISLVGMGDIDMSLSKVLSTHITLIGVGDIDVKFKDCRSANCRLIGVGNIELSGNVDRLSSEQKGTGSIDLDNLTVKESIP